MRKNPVPPQRSTLPSRGCVAVLAAARIAEDHGQKGYRVRIIEGLGRYPYPRAGDHPSGTRTGAPAPIPERPGGLEGKQADTGPTAPRLIQRSEEHTSELQSLMRISYAVFCLKKKKQTITHKTQTTSH